MINDIEISCLEQELNKLKKELCILSVKLENQWIDIFNLQAEIAFRQLTTIEKGE